MSDDEELLFGLLGTQFNTDADEQTEYKRSKLKRKAADEEVVDAKGRATRFHGAFTGGFSAGYFNTVGSKEGFQPSEFVSQGKSNSRNYRPSKPEDFMDDDDFGENGIAPRLLRTKSIFDNEDIRSHMKQTLGSHDIVGDSDILKDILVPQNITIGLILLRKLGYLASRGVGENSHYISSDIEDEEISFTKKFDYEAEETFQLIAKTDKFGLGYSGMSRDLISAVETKDNRGVNFGLKGKKGIRGVAFGGVDEDDDDYIRDIFGHESMSKYNYEYIEDDKEVNFGWTAPKHLKNTIMPSDTINGFQMGSKCAKSSKVHYEPLKPPRFYLPIYPIRREKENIEQKGRLERPKLMPNEDKGSVFSLLSTSDRERLQNMGKENHTRRSGSRWGDSVKPTVKEDAFDITATLTSIRNETTRNSLQPPTGDLVPRFGPQTQVRKSWAMASNLSSKFKSAGSSTSNEDMGYHLKNEIKATGNDLELSTKDMAAKAETYGFMTRSTLQWHPDKLLCKRFNVPDPYPGSKMVGIPDEIEFPVERRSGRHSPKMSPDKPLPIIEAPQTFDTKTEPEIKVEEVSVVEIKVIVPDLSDKPPMDLFKAVFDDADADFSSDEEEKDAPIEVVPEKVQESAPVSILSSMEQALGAMFGDEGRKPASRIAPPVTVPKEGPRIFGPTPPPDFVFNPVIPDSRVRSVNEIISKNIPPPIPTTNEATDSYVYLEKSTAKKVKHEKKSKKSKKSKGTKKEKHKKKTKKRKQTSDSGDTSSD